jgi:hypothetical protein
MRPSPFAPLLILLVLAHVALTGCGSSSASPPSIVMAPTVTHTRVVPSQIPSVSPVPPPTSTVSPVLVDVPADWSNLPGIGTPVHGEGTIITVVHVIGTQAMGETPRPLIVNIRLRNESAQSQTISPASFLVFHQSGVSFAVNAINFEQGPRDKQEIAPFQQLHASLLVSAAFPLEELALQYSPDPATPPIHVRFTEATEAPNAALAQLDVTSLIIAEGDLPAMFRAGDVFTTVPPALPLGGIERPQRFAGQFVQRDDPRQILNVIILFYNNRDSVDGVYDTVEQGKHEVLDQIGERASWREMDRTIQFRQLTFTRCQAVVLMLMSGRTDDEFVPKEVVLQYAQRLDQRLQAAVCP